MPHLLIERIRTIPAVCSCCKRPSKEGQEYRRDVGCAYAVEVLDIICSLVFIIGSACFLPTFSQDRDIFLLGCVLFVLGTAGYLGLSVFTLAEALYEKGLESLETVENSLYVAGSLLYVVGTILYWPKKDDWPIVVATQEFSPGQYFNWFSPELEGTILFIIGSVLYVLAAYVNGLNQRGFETPIKKMLTASTTCYMVGGILFTMGSVAFLPELGCGDKMEEFGAIMFVIGSFFYMTGSVISLIRTSLQLDDPEYAPLAKPLRGQRGPAPKEVVP